MNRFLLILAAAFLVAPMATAHDPPGPNATCDARQKQHDYVPPPRPYEVRVNDGNVTDCIEGANAVVVDLRPLAPCILGLFGFCYPLDAGLEQPFADYDGDLEYGHGGAILFADTGDGESFGSGACHGGVAHHGDEVFAADVLGFGPRFLVVTDFSRASSHTYPDCGDGYLEPCMDSSPPPSTLPFPANAAVDSANLLAYQLFGPSGLTCNARERGQWMESTAVGPSGGKVPFGPGADGAYVVFLDRDVDYGRIPTSGHIWG